MQVFFAPTSILVVDINIHPEYPATTQVAKGFV